MLYPERLSEEDALQLRLLYGDLRDLCAKLPITIILGGKIYEQN